MEKADYEWRMDMRRWLLTLVMGVFLVGASHTSVQAERSKARHGKVHKGKGKRRRAKKPKPVLSPEVSKAMADLKWGMGKSDVVRWAREKVRDRYRPKLAKVHDSVEDDSLRNEMNEELKRIDDSYVKFTGKSTGWDVSFLRGEFTHRNGEAMLTLKDSNSQNFYFFIKGRLWKWYKAFDDRAFKGKSFKAFANALERKFGSAKRVRGELVEGAGERSWLEWRDRKTRLRAVDQSEFYGFYSLVFEDRAALEQLSALRSHKSARGPDSHALVDAVTSGDVADVDETPDVVDRITGKRRGHVETSGRIAAGSGNLRARRKAAFSRRRKYEKSERQRVKRAAPEEEGPATDDDPLLGLDGL